MGLYHSPANPAIPTQNPKILQLAQASSTSVLSASPTSKPNSQARTSHRGFVAPSLWGLGLLGSIGFILYLIRRFGQIKQVQQPQTVDTKTETTANEESGMSLSKLDTTPNPVENIPIASISTKLSSTEQTSHLARFNIVDELMKDLHSHDPSRRRKAIWHLGQRGDSRAIKPLLDLMVNVDSQQRSLILSAVGEISTRALKPMNRALAISMQDESPQVRQNAIRDLTRVYDTMAQISQILYHALEDPDTEVQATAKYALNQMNRIRLAPEQQSPPEK